MGIQWGSVADWVSSLGSLGAVTAALIIANMESNRAANAERYSIKAAEERDKAVSTAALNLIDESLAMTSGVSSSISNGLPMGEAPIKWRDTLNDMKVKSVRLQQLPTISVPVFMALDRMIAAVDRSAPFHNYHISELEDECNGFEAEMRDVQGLLRKIRGDDPREIMK